MAHPVVHFEIRSADPDATREFFGNLFGWKFPDGGMPGYSYVETGVEGAIPGGNAQITGTFTQAQAVVQPSLPERDLLAVWN